MKAITFAVALSYFYKRVPAWIEGEGYITKTTKSVSPACRAPVISKSAGGRTGVKTLVQLWKKDPTGCERTSSRKQISAQVTKNRNISEKFLECYVCKRVPQLVGLRKFWKMYIPSLHEISLAGSKVVSNSTRAIEQRIHPDPSLQHVQQSLQGIAEFSLCVCPTVQIHLFPPASRQTPTPPPSLAPWSHLLCHANTAIF